MIGARVSGVLKVKEPNGRTYSIRIPHAHFASLSSDGRETSLEIGGITEMTVTERINTSKENA